LPRKPNISFKLGTAIHESLKVAGLIWKKKENFTKYDIQKIKEAYRKEAAKEGIEDMAVYNEGMLMLTSKLKDFESGKIIEVEDRFEVTTDEGIMLIGAIDKAVELADDSLLIVDYKTSKFNYTAEEMKHDIQLSIYDIAASIKFPGYKRIILCLDYLRSEPAFTYRSHKERKNFTQYMLAIYNEMLSLEEKDATATINEFCNWCDFKDECQEYRKAAVVDEKFEKKNPENCTDDELAGEYIKTKNRKRILDNYERKLKGYILAKIKADEEDLEGAGKTIYVRQNPSTTYDPKSVHSVVPLNEFLRMISVSKKKADEYLEDVPSIDKAKIMETAAKSYTNPFLAIRATRK
jgi:RecB family exonuclease